MPWSAAPAEASLWLLPPVENTLERPAMNTPVPPNSLAPIKPEPPKILKKTPECLRNNAGELAMIDAADCGNPIAEMIMDATIAAAQIEFFAGLVTEMKGSSIP